MLSPPLSCCASGWITGTGTTSKTPLRSSWLTCSSWAPWDHPVGTVKSLSLRPRLPACPVQNAGLLIWHLTVQMLSSPQCVNTFLLRVPAMQNRLAYNIRYLSCPNAIVQCYPAFYFAPPPRPFPLCVHTKWGQAQTNLHNSRLEGTARKKCSSPCPARGLNPGLQICILALSNH